MYILFSSSLAVSYYVRKVCKEAHALPYNTDYRADKSAVYYPHEGNHHEYGFYGIFLIVPESNRNQNIAHYRNNGNGVLVGDKPENNKYYAEKYGHGRGGHKLVISLKVRGEYHYCGNNRAGTAAAGVQHNVMYRP